MTSPVNNPQNNLMSFLHTDDRFYGVVSYLNGTTEAPQINGKHALSMSPFMGQLSDAINKCGSEDMKARLPILKRTFASLYSDAARSLRTLAVVTTIAGLLYAGANAVREQKSDWV